MGILDIRPAARGGSKAIIAICGTTGSGKTLTALLIARGMVKSAKEIGFLDTEHKRGSFYADKLDAPFMIADLYPPFSPSRYAAAIREYQEAGVKVLVIDSGSHEWEGEGGCEDIANAAILNGKVMANWKLAKKEHKGFMNVLLHCDMHLIICIRAREKTSFSNPKDPVSLGIQPICEKSFMFEMMASFMVENQGRNQKFIKIPEFLLPAFGDGNGYLGIQTGKKILEWVEKGETPDAEIEKIKSEMLMACENGLEAVLKIWTPLSKTLKTKLESHKNICKESALEYEKQAKQGEQTPAEQLADTKAELEKKGEQTALNLP